MKVTGPILAACAMVALLVTMSVGLELTTVAEPAVFVAPTNLAPPRPPALQYSVYRTGVLEIAKVFGKMSGCENADSELIEEVNRASARVGLGPRLVAATIAVESRCDALAVSREGAVGLMQPVPRIWKHRYDFAAVNLFKPQDNLMVGTTILAGLVQEYGVREGLHRYNGLGYGCAACDPTYAERILVLAKETR